MAPTPPDLTDSQHGGFIVAFIPTSYWVAGNYDPAALIATLKQQHELADFKDETGNAQSAVRLDLDADPTNIGYWVSVPKGTSETIIEAAIAAYVPPLPSPSPHPGSADAALTAVSKLDPNTATAAEIVNTVKQALQQSTTEPA